MTDPRDLIQRLTDALTAHHQLPGRVPLITEARAYLAASDEPAATDGREPTDERLPELMPGTMRDELAVCAAADRARAARRPKPPSLAEEARAHLDQLINAIGHEGALAMAEPIRHALDALERLQRLEEKQ